VIAILQTLNQAVMKFVKNTLFPHGVQEIAGSNPVASTITSQMLLLFL